jgi:peptidyl-prolyl cis-trans isomerase D
MMNIIREKAKWFVAVPVLCFGALIFVDWGMSPGNSMTQRNVVGKVDGEKVPFETFNKEVEAVAKQATGEGRELDAQQYAEIRSEVFEKFVRQKIYRADFERYSLSGSPVEILEHLKSNPPPGAEKAPIFMGPDSQFSRAKYLQWLATPKVFDDPYMRVLEQQLTNTVVPEQQITQILAAIQPISDLEIGFRAKLDRSKVWATLLLMGTDSFTVDASKISDAEVKAWFDKNTDSLWHSKAVGVVPYVTLPKTPSADDSLSAKKQIDSVVAQLKSGEKFDELARNYSEDPGSAKQGGDLGGYQSLKRWVPEFAAAARMLDSGKISDPVRTQFGWHVILSKGRKIENGDTLYALSHILVTIQTTPETVDSLKSVAEDFRKMVKAGSTFAEAAAKFKLKVDSSAPLTEGGAKNGLATGYVPGLSAYVFHGDESVSEVLENRQAVHVVGRGQVYQPGRHLEIDRSYIRQRIATDKSAELAKAWLENSRTKAMACDTSRVCLNALGKGAGVLGLDGRPISTFVDGFGYSSPELLRLWKGAKPKQWTDAAIGNRQILIMSVDSSHTPTAAEEAQSVAGIRPNMLRMRMRGALESWYNWRKSLAKVENHLDRYFRD